MEGILEAWCDKLLQMNFDVRLEPVKRAQRLGLWLMEHTLQNPMIRKRMLQLLVFFSTTALHKNKDFMLKVLEHILMTWPALEPEYRAFNDAVKDLQGESMIELQRLAVEMPDHLLVRSTPIQHCSLVFANCCTRACMIRSRDVSVK